jgi:predicted type IV restriction endonuclease
VTVPADARAQIKSDQTEKNDCEIEIIEKQERKTMPQEIKEHRLSLRMQS